MRQPLRLIAERWRKFRQPQRLPASAPQCVDDAEEEPPRNRPFGKKITAAMPIKNATAPRSIEFHERYRVVDPRMRKLPATPSMLV